MNDEGDDTSNNEDVDSEEPEPEPEPDLNCTDSDAIVDIVDNTTSGDTSLATNDLSSACIEPSATNAPDIVHRITFPGRLTSLIVDTRRSSSLGSQFNTIIDIRKDNCTSGGFIGCDEGNGDEVGSDSDIFTSLITASNLEAGTYYIRVDGVGTSSGLYDLNLNGTIDTGEQCDINQINTGIVSCSTGESCVAGVCQ